MFLWPCPRLATWMLHRIHASLSPSRTLRLRPAAATRQAIFLSNELDRQGWLLAYTGAFKKTVSGPGSISPNLGGGKADIGLAEDIIGIAYGWKF